MGGAAGGTLASASAAAGTTTWAACARPEMHASEQRTSQAAARAITAPQPRGRQGAAPRRRPHLLPVAPQHAQHRHGHAVGRLPLGLAAYVTHLRGQPKGRGGGVLGRRGVGGEAGGWGVGRVEAAAPPLSQGPLEGGAPRSRCRAAARRQLVCRTSEADWRRGADSALVPHAAVPPGPRIPPLAGSCDARARGPQLSQPGGGTSRASGRLGRARPRPQRTSSWLPVKALGRNSALEMMFRTLSCGGAAKRAPSAERGSFSPGQLPWLHARRTPAWPARRTWPAPPWPPPAGRRRVGSRPWCTAPAAAAPTRPKS
jgi:hypothetical protein